MPYFSFSLLPSSQALTHLLEVSVGISKLVSLTIFPSESISLTLKSENLCFIMASKPLSSPLTYLIFQFLSINQNFNLTLFIYSDMPTSSSEVLPTKLLTSGLIRYSSSPCGSSNFLVP